MSTNIDSLKTIELDYTGRGPNLHLGYSRAVAALNEARTGFLRLNTKFSAAKVPVIMRSADLYLLGFQAADGWWRFSDSDWPLTPTAANLGYEGRYACLGGLTGALTLGGLRSVGELADPKARGQWKYHLRTLLVVVAENLRLIPVQMAVLSLLNEISQAISLSSLERYIHAWGKASEGKDMSVQVSPHLWKGFRDPTIVRR